MKEFFEANSKKSSKRLAGLSATFLFLFLTLIGGIVFLINAKYHLFTELLVIIVGFAATCLGLGISDNYLNKRYDKGNNNNKLN